MDFGAAQEAVAARQVQAGPGSQPRGEPPNARELVGHEAAGVSEDEYSDDFDGEGGGDSGESDTEDHDDNEKVNTVGGGS